MVFFLIYAVFHAAAVHLAIWLLMPGFPPRQRAAWRRKGAGWRLTALVVEL
jgi:hypothetical protein